VAKQYVALRANPRLGIVVEEGATVGAQIGTDLRLPDGSVPTLAQLAQALGISVGQAQTIVEWANLVRVPLNVVALEGATGTGLFAVTGAGTGASREITVTAGELTVSNGSGVSGNPSLGLADVTPSAGGTLQLTAFDTKGRRSHEGAASTTNLPEGDNLYFTQSRVQETPLASHSAASLPPATTPGQMIYVPDESGGAVPAFSDGSNWLRVTDRAIVS